VIRVHQAWAIRLPRQVLKCIAFGSDALSDASGWTPAGRWFSPNSSSVNMPASKLSGETPPDRMSMSRTSEGPGPERPQTRRAGDPPAHVGYHDHTVGHPQRGELTPKTG